MLSGCMHAVLARIYVYISLEPDTESAAMEGQELYDDVENATNGVPNIEVTTSKGRKDVFPFVWLRDNCRFSILIHAFDMLKTFS